MTNIEVEDTSKLPEAEPLKQLNQQFHEQLDALRIAMREQLDDGSIPVVVRLDRRIVLALGDARTILDINESYYHQLKALAHIPLLLFLAAHNGRGAAETEAGVIDALTVLHDDRALPSDSLTYIQEAAAELFGSKHWPVLEFSAVRQFNDTLQPAFQTLVELAAMDEAAKTLQALRQLEAIVDDEGLWKQAYYVVCAGHQPRYKQLGKMLFERWVFEQSKSAAEVEQRVLYGESLESVDAARELVVTRMVNGLIGDAFLNSPLSMNRDVLGQAGEIAVSKAFSEEGAACNEHQE